MAEQPVVSLPATVENLIEKICLEQSQAPLEFFVRQRLAEIGEDQACELLNYISTQKIKKTFGSFIIFMLNKYSSSPSKPSTQSPVAPFSFSTPSQSPVSQSPVEAVAALSALGDLEFRKAFLLMSYCGRQRVDSTKKRKRHRVENVVTAEDITRYKDLPMRDFEKIIWEAWGEKYIYSKSDRQLYADWDLRRTHVYQCDVSPDGSLRFKGPILQSTRTHLQKSLGDDNVLVVKFAEDKNVRNTNTSSEDAARRYGKFVKEGIRVGHRLYRFFVFKDGGKEAKKKDPTSSSVKCYFVRTESNSSADDRASYILSNKTMIEARSSFMHIHTLPNIDKYMARFSLILSKTMTLKIDLATVRVQKIPDEYCLDNGNYIYHKGKPRILTDGTGFISEDLAVLCPNDVVKGMHFKSKYIEELANLVEHEDMSNTVGKTPPSTHQPPLLIQCRLFHMGTAIKGTLLINKKLPPKTIQVRPSMIKVETDPNLQNIESINSLEVVNTSIKPRRSYLSKYLIAFLSYGGVPNEFFMDLLRTNLEDASNMYSNKRNALRASVNNGEMDEYIAAEMILCGIPLDEPYLHSHLSFLAKQETNGLRGGKLYLPDCFYVMGTVDPTGRLGKDQVCIIHDNGQITGDVLVYHNPGLHFGDIHILHARYVEELESYVGHSKYAIFFPCVGQRSLADEIAGADFDGDMFWVSKNPQLLQYFRKSVPWIESPAPCDSRLASSVKNPSELAAEELEEELFKLFLDTRFQASYTMGIAAHSWMALMDRFLILRNDCNKEREKIHLRENMLKLIDIYYEALDAPKAGGVKIQVPKELAAEMFPHYMEKDKSFTSTSILGLIYDEVCRYQTNDEMSGKEIRKLPCFDVEIPTSYMEKWEKLYGKYRKDMSNVLRDDNEDVYTGLSNNSKSLKSKGTNSAASEVIKIYKQELYGASNMEDSQKSISEIYKEALAVYHVTYNYAIQCNEDYGRKCRRCAFVWKIAGSALTRLYLMQQNQKPLACNPSALREIFGS